MGAIPIPTRTNTRKHTPKTRLAVLWFGAAVLVLVVVNALLFGIYHDRTYPRTTMGRLSAGNAGYAQLQTLAAGQNIENLLLQLQYASQKVTLPVGASLKLDAARTKVSVAASRSWFPIVAVFRKHVAALPVNIDAPKLQKALPQLESTFHQDAVNAKVTLTGDHFKTSRAHNGYALDTSALDSKILQALDRGQTSVTVPVKQLAPSVTQAQANASAQKLQRSLNVTLNYTYTAASQKPGPTDIASWYVPAGDTYQLNDFAIRTYIAKAGVKMGVHPKDLTAAVNATKQAVQQAGTATIALQPFATTKTYNYCVSGRGTTSAELSALKTKLVETYSDLRGWSLDGQIIFNYATSGCDFTVWLTAPAQMTSFGAICDPYWNCEVDNNVIVNNDRWNDTTDTWKAAGGNLEDYRTMLIDHETGHMLGFGHTGCPGIGQPAPVMMQESIDLQGCVFNIWPVQNELSTLRAKLGL